MNQVLIYIVVILIIETAVMLYVINDNKKIYSRIRKVLELYSIEANRRYPVGTGALLERVAFVRGIHYVIDKMLEEKDEEVSTEEVEI